LLPQIMAPALRIVAAIAVFALAHRALRATDA
jgi:hypothetical protein